VEASLYHWFSRRDFVVLSTSVAAIGAVVLVLRLLPGISPTTAALALLLVVLGAATQGRLRVATLVSLIATLAFNFFFIPPIHTFTVVDTQNWVALVVFLTVAIIASNLSAAAQERAREAQRADLASTLLASLSHDMRTPLTAIKVAMENLGEELPRADREAQATAAVTEIDRLTRLFEDILAMARIDAAAIDVERQWVAPADIVDAATVYARLALDGRPLRVDADDEHEIELDPRLVSVALAHLLENGARYSPPTTPIIVSARVGARELRITVSDFGPGIDAEELNHLFERFYRGRAARQTTGTGMGLSIARGLLAAAGGTVSAEDVPGTGARFSIVVPGSVRLSARPAPNPASFATAK
jgi:two-component system sensor histidine kinase KdpD